MVTKDTRDLRDPRQFPDLSGHYRHFLSISEMHETSFHEFVDEYWSEKLKEVPNYPGDESLATVTAREYRAELQERANHGDIYATSRLQGLMWDEPD